ncbi:hypothetical protein VKS41_005132 [Umbelopsis sp. WA50703]
MIQYEIIIALPYIVNDSEHKGLVACLTTMMQNDQDLIASILEALSNFSLQPEDLDDIRDTMIDQLDSANMDDLPVIMRFLLQTSTAETIEQNILKIRQKLDFKALAKLQQVQRDVVSFKAANAASHRGTIPEALVLDNIKQGLQFQKFISDAWLKVIMDKETPNGYKIIDILVLFILHSMAPPTKKKVEQIFKKKITSKVLSADLCRETIVHHAEGINSLWNSILSLAESLLRSNPTQASIVAVSSVIYKNAFKMCSAFYRQPIGNLYFAEVDAALKTLLELVKEDPDSISPFVVFIKGVLDYLDKLTIDQIGVLFDIFSFIAVESHNTASDDQSLFHLMNDMQIIIRKQLSNPLERYKKIGIMGALSVVKAMGSAEVTKQIAAGSGSTQISASQAGRHPTLQQAISMLETVFRSCAGFSACLALAYDELSYFISQNILDKRLELWIKDNLVCAFPDIYAFDYDEMQLYVSEREDQSPFKPQIWYNLDGEEAQIMLQVFRIIDSPKESIEGQRAKHQYPAVAMCPFFNLLQACEKATNNGSLEEVDALLGCGLLLYETDLAIEKLELRYRENACNMLFFAINWLREVLNAFCESDDQATVQKLVARLNNIHELEGQLMRLLACTPSFVIQGYTLKTTVDEVASKDNSSKKGISIVSQVGKRTDQMESDGSEIEPIQATARSSRKSSKPTASFDDVSTVRLLMRELQIEALQILRTGRNPDIQHPLKLYSFNYLVTDLLQKLRTKLAPPVVNSFFGKKKKDPASLYVRSDISYLQRMNASGLVEKVLPYLPSLLDQLERMLAESSQDENITEDETYECVTLILNVFVELLTWHELNDAANESLKKTLLCVFALRVDSTLNRLQDIQKLVRNAFSYMHAFTTRIKRGEGAVQLLKVIASIRQFSPTDRTLSLQVQMEAKNILAKNWSDSKEMKRYVSYLLEQEIAEGDQSLGIIRVYLTTVLPAFDDGDTDTLEAYPLLRKDTLPVFYQALATEVVKAHRNFKENQESDDMCIMQLSQIIECFEALTSYIRSKDNRALLSVILKSSRMFIEQMTKRTISYLSSRFKTHRSAVISILKHFQIGTKTLQIVCSHVKIVRDIQLSSYVPALKKALEIVIYHAKALLTDNNAPANAFYLGALKHRDITGAEVSSQITMESSDESDINELGSDDDTNDVSREETSNVPNKQRYQAPGNRVRPVVTAIPVYRSSSRVPTSEDESDEEIPANQGSPHSTENVTPSPRDNTEVEPTAAGNTSVDGRASMSRENSDVTDTPRKKRKLGTGFSRRPNNAPLQSRQSN